MAIHHQYFSASSLEQAFPRLCRGVNVKMFVQMQKSQLIYFRKNLGFGAWLTAKVMFIISDSVRSAAWFLSSLVNQDRRLRRKSAAGMAALRFHLLGVEPT